MSLDIDQEKERTSDILMMIFSRSFFILYG